ncbi:DUF190 domain-containing protein [Thiohalobacter thiocyanaticus]|uniref:DUF190 domain-containing protein n=1 Tax=Thiohalobacter thiocyanaticus TaxID=585455 RepID=A0A426QDX6_9GAMM|nr:DUF190 domain-containing protein [Thiohalobacter thiocyanaticus]RRQ19972.1 DUF190 domain-containing protein [Thiohalobacter thiocyanaticus]
MKQIEITFVRVYMTDDEERHAHLVKRLHDEEKVRGVTVFRGVSGFGPSGRMHEARLVDLALDLPLVIEFFDTPEKVRRILDHLEDQIAPGHIVTWPATVHE